MKSQFKQSVMEMATEYPKVITTAGGGNALEKLWSSNTKRSVDL